MILGGSVFRFSLLFEHDLFRKPESTFRDHALAQRATAATHPVIASEAKQSRKSSKSWIASSLCSSQ
jgi:hypothetical protein